MPMKMQVGAATKTCKSDKWRGAAAGGVTSLLICCVIFIENHQTSFIQTRNRCGHFSLKKFHVSVIQRAVFKHPRHIGNKQESTG